MNDRPMSSPILQRLRNVRKVNDSDCLVVSVVTFQIVHTPLPEANKKRVKSPWSLSPHENTVNLHILDNHLHQFVEKHIH